MPGACFDARVRAGAVPAPGESLHLRQKQKAARSRGAFSRRLPEFPLHAILLKNAKGAHGMGEKLRQLTWLGARTLSHEELSGFGAELKRETEEYQRAIAAVLNEEE